MSARPSARTALATTAAILTVGGVAITTKDANLTGLVGAFVTTLLGTLTNRHTAADISSARANRASSPSTPEPTP